MSTISEKYSRNYNNQGIFYTLPLDIRKVIINFTANSIIFDLVYQEVFSNDDIKNTHSKLNFLSKVCIEFNVFSQIKLKEIKTIFNLYNKYSVYNDDYLRLGCGWLGNEKYMVPCGNPQLLDVLSTGLYLPFVRHSFTLFGKNQEDDLKTIIKLFPRSISCNIGSMRCRDFITPFIVACYNPFISTEIIEFLLNNGANPNSILSLNGNKIHILADLKNNNPTRYQQILPVLTKYGAVETIFNCERYVQ